MIGTAMGTDVAPTFSTLTVGYSEIKLYNLCEQNWGVEMRNYVYENWSLFLDDCEILLDQIKVTPEEFLEMLNSININIQYAMEKSETEIPFLDILIKQDDTGIPMDLYRTTHAIAKRAYPSPSQEGIVSCWRTTLPNKSIWRN